VLAFFQKYNYFPKMISPNTIIQCFNSTSVAGLQLDYPLQDLSKGQFQLIGLCSTFLNFVRYALAYDAAELTAKFQELDLKEIPE